MNKKIIENIELTGIHSAGKAIGKFRNRNIFVKNGIPGEIVNIEIPRRIKQGKYTIGEIVKFHNSSPERNLPFCRHFNQCGGCNWQHLNYEAQLKLKIVILKNAFEKYNIKTPQINDVIGSPKTKFYRNKTEYATSILNISEPDEEYIKTTDTIIGFHPAGSPNDVLDIEECYLQDFSGKIDYQDLKRIIQQWNNSHYNTYLSIISFVIRTTSSGEVMLVFYVNEFHSEFENLYQNIISKFPELDSIYILVKNENTNENSYYHLHGKLLIHETINNLKFFYGPDSFYQPNPMQAINIYNKLVEFAGLTGKELVYDLYTGIGTIACILANKALKVIGIEGIVNAVENAKINAKANKIENAEFIAGDILETFKPEFVNRYGKPDLIVLDPPRSGTLIEIKKAMLWAELEKIIYLSCNPVSLAWDLKQLTEKYEIISIQPFDMFPHTHHLETLVLMSLRK